MLFSYIDNLFVAWDFLVCAFAASSPCPIILCNLLTSLFLLPPGLCFCAHSTSCPSSCFLCISLSHSCLSLPPVCMCLLPPKLRHLISTYPVPHLLTSSPAIRSLPLPCSSSYAPTPNLLLLPCADSGGVTYFQLLHVLVRQALVYHMKKEISGGIMWTFSCVMVIHSFSSHGLPFVADKHSGWMNWAGRLCPHHVCPTNSWDIIIGDSSIHSPSAYSPRQYLRPTTDGTRFIRT